MKNWKTTLAGVLSAVAQIVVLPIHGWKDLIIPVMSALIGVFASDSK